MANFSGRSGPLNVDVIAIVPFDTRAVEGIDPVSDLRIFVQSGLTVALLFPNQSGSVARYRNNKLLQLAFELDIPILGLKDSCIAQVAIVYDTEVVASRSLRGNFLAANIAFMIPVTENNSSSEVLDLAISFNTRYSTGKPLLLSTSSVHANYLKQMTTELEIINWSFFSPEGLQVRTVTQQHSELTRIGIPDPTGSKIATQDADNLSKMFRSHNETRLCLLNTIPRALQTSKNEPDYVLGLPFVPREQDEFIKHLDSYIVSNTAFEESDWYSDVILCINSAIPMLLPRKLEKYFGELAQYHDAAIGEGEINSLLFEYNAKTLIVNGSYDLRSARLRTLRRLGVAGPEDLLDKTETHNRRNDIVPQAENDLNSNKSPRVCFVTSNGAGMGHLTRLLAVGRRLPADVDVSFISMSQACAVVAEYGYKYEYIPSKGDLNADGAEWNQYFNQQFIAALDRARPDVVVFDGTWPYQGITLAIENYNARFVWMRRGMWRQETQSTSLVRSTNFDLVISPGDVAESYDRGPTSLTRDSVQVDPVIVMDKSETLSRADARNELGISASSKVMLITLGAGNINSIDEDVTAVIETVQKLNDSWQIFITNPLIAETSFSQENVRTISIYPLAKYAKAFDFVVSATGYNSYHEWIAYGVPALWIPNSNTITDDQLGRAVYAHDFGLGYMANSGELHAIELAINNLGDDAVRSSIREKLETASFTNGAYAAAEHISTIARESVK